MLSWLLGTVVVVIIVAVAGEWFIEVAKDKGWYSNAGQNWDNAMGVVTSYLTNPALYIPFTGLAGVVGGLWIDTALKFFEAKNKKPKEVDWIFLETEVSRIQHLIARDFHMKDETEAGYSPIRQETATGFFALLFYLYHRGMAPQDGIPSPNLANDPELFFELSSRYLAAIDPFVRAKDVQGASHFGGMTVNLVYDWSNDLKAERSKSECQSPQLQTETE